MVLFHVRSLNMLLFMMRLIGTIALGNGIVHRTGMMTYSYNAVGNARRHCKCLHSMKAMCNMYNTDRKGSRYQFLQFLRRCVEHR